MRHLLVLGLVAITGAATAQVRTKARSVRQRERITCSIAAALELGIPTDVLLAVAEIEGGRPGQWVRNRNGSFDVGPLQFNTNYLEHLKQRYGITAADVAAAGCYPYELAAWRLRKHLEYDHGDLWTRVANYHSRSPSQNAKYRRKLIRKAAQWARWLSARVPTYEARIPSTRGCVFNKQRHQSKPKRQTGSATELVPKVEDDGADLVSLVTLLNDEDGEQPTMPRDSGSVGSAHAGSLRAAVQLPAHSGYVVRDPARAWGTADTIDRLTSAFDEVTRADPFAPRVRVHDLSLLHGGPMRGHKSHQSGRDVDITYYQRTCQGACDGRPVAPSKLDAGRQWRLLRYWLEHGHVEFIFIDYALQHPLYDQAKSAGATPRQLAQWFQYPRGPGVPAGIIRHVPDHANHVHVRFRCTAADRTCTPTRMRVSESLSDQRSVTASAPIQDESEQLLDLLEE